MLKHGSTWSGYTKKRDDTKEKWTSGAKKHSSEFAISWDAILSAEFRVIEELEREMSKQMVEAFQATMVETIEESTRDKESIDIDFCGDIRPGFIKLVESTAIGLNEDLSASEPVLMLNPEMFGKLRRKADELESADPSFRSRIDVIKKRMYCEALVAYLENLLKFQLYEEDRWSVEYQLRRIRARTTTEFELHQKGCDDDTREPSR